MRIILRGKLQHRLQLSAKKRIRKVVKHRRVYHRSERHIIQPLWDRFVPHRLWAIPALERHAIGRYLNNEN